MVGRYVIFFSLFLDYCIGGWVFFFRLGCGSGRGFFFGCTGAAYLAYV
jgi:hypothetical protein